jgi:predicted dehydrogenase
MNRRQLLRRSAVAASAVAIPTLIPRGALAQPGRPGPNDRIRVAFIGLGGRARALLTQEDISQAQVVAFCDCEVGRAEGAVKLKPEFAQAAVYQDYRKMYEKTKLDAVFVETTCHARVLTMIHALQAGLDVYGEKPLTLTIAEGRTLVKAVRKFNKILQTGTQQRSMPINRFASKLVREGALGKIHTVIACNFEGGRDWAPKPGGAVPQGLDWDAWCNQAPLRPYLRELHRDWGWIWDYDGGGQMWGVTGWGTHAYDQIQCALGTDDTGPVEVWPEDSGPMCKVTMRFANGTLVKLHGAKRKGFDDLGAIFEGEKGKIEILRGSCKADPPDLLKGAPGNSPLCKPGESTDHLKNFFECLRSRKLPNADVEIGHRATTFCHLVNLCRELGRKFKWDPVTEKVVGDDAANKSRFITRERRKGYELPVI